MSAGEDPDDRLRRQTRALVELAKSGTASQSLDAAFERITHVDTRLANGNNTPQPACIASFTRS